MFLTNCPDVHSPKFLSVVRVKPGSAIRGTVCGEPLRAMIHYYRGKSYPCVSTERAPCSLCSKHLPKRPYAWWPVRGKSGAGILIETTQTVDVQLAEGLKNCPQNHLLLLTVSRSSGKKNAPLGCEIDYRELLDEERAHQFRTTIDMDLMKRCLCRLWDLPEWDPGCREDDYYEMVARYITEMVANEVLS